MRIYMSVDAEGISGIYKFSQVLRDDPEFPFCRRMMASDVNAAIRGAKKAGAIDIVINDAHNLGDNLIIDALEPGVKLISGVDRPDSMMEGIGRGFDAALLIGYHSRKQARGVAPHSYSYWSMLDVRLNGESISEYELNGYLAGHYGVPVVFLSGDDRITADAAGRIDGLFTTTTKEAVGNGSAICYHPADTAKQIERTVEKALTSRQGKDIRPMKLASRPIELEIRFMNTSRADNVMNCSLFARRDDCTVAFKADSYYDVYKAFLVAANLGGAFKDV